MARTLRFAVALSVVVGAAPVSAQQGPDLSVARLVPKACTMKNESGRDMACFDLVVPQNWAKPDGRTVTLPVLVFKAAAGAREPDPVVQITGGPGAIAFTEEKYDYAWTDRFKEWTWLAGRDLIVFDQRGVGGARPALECPEVDETRKAPLDDALYIAASQACRARLAATLEPKGFDTAATVLDLAALRRAMGIAEWTLWGQSYGSRVALAAMRSRPEGIRAAILDGAYPPEISGRSHAAAGLVRTLGKIFAACQADATCAADYPDLEATFKRVLDRLRREPVTLVSDTEPLLPKTRHRVNDVILIAIVANLVYTREGIGKLPWLIHWLDRGEISLLAEPLADWDLVSYGPYITTGASFLIDCNDDPRWDDSADRAIAERHPHLKPWIDFALAVRPCVYWNPGGGGTLDTAPRPSPIPTLIIAGGYDIATPPEWATLTAKSLQVSRVLHVPAASHDASDVPCARAALSRFLDNPAAVATVPECPAGETPKFRRPPEKDKER
jgi:pimeloyl-ACP methyl ester carboxylesterase